MLGGVNPTVDIGVISWGEIEFGFLLHLVASQYFMHRVHRKCIFFNREVLNGLAAFTDPPGDIPLRRKGFAAAAESFAEKIEEMLLGREEAAVTGALKEAPEEEKEEQ